MSILGLTLNNVTIGEPVVHMNLAMFPLLGGASAEAPYLTFEEALATGQARVTEVSEGGSVPELRFENGCDRPVMLLDGEELVGAKQNRMLNLTILAPAKSTIDIPVSCVEAGRWHSVSREFGASGRAQYAEVRACKTGHVSESLRSTGSRRSDQSAVWNDIDRKMASMNVQSRTRSADDMYTRHRENVEDYVSAIRQVPGQGGAAFAINGRVIGLDLFDSVLTMSRMLPKLVRSYAMDAIGSQRAGGHPNTADLDRLLADIRDARVESFKAVGMGDDLRITGRLCQGAALSVEDRIVHLCAFAAIPVNSSGRQDGRSNFVPSSVRRRRFH